MSFYAGPSRVYRRRRSSATQDAVRQLERLDDEREAIFRTYPDLRAMMHERSSLLPRRGTSGARPRSRATDETGSS